MHIGYTKRRLSQEKYLSTEVNDYEECHEIGNKKMNWTKNIPPDATSISPNMRG